MTLVGIDFGSQQAGTTVIAWKSAENTVQMAHSAKNKNADAFLWHYLQQIQPELIAIDAPLSLPGVYQQLAGYQDYFYRQADRATQAMSPMFLGGLTARAIQLATTWKQQHPTTTILETYPRLQADRLQLPHYKQKDPQYLLQALTQILSETSWQLATQSTIQNWHQIDALLALMTAERYQNQRAIAYGNKIEGLIFI